ncbi:MULTISPECIES: DUF6538 domain-containing protein [unclassified Sulfitobacter]|uniref:DUF6538 domain-containing protein n=1 Tax=unclassified Sulfitobacter TaxID=196795 RepID=UPI0031FEEE1C
MPLSIYLYQQRGQYYFRRRIPKLSTSRSPVLVSLGTKDPNLALTCVGMLTMEFENVLDAFTFVLDEIPEELMHRYMKVRLTQSIQKSRRQRRLEWVLGRSGFAAPENRKPLRIALASLLQNGIGKPFPPSQINPEWSSDMLADIMRCHHAEAHALLAPETMNALTEEFTKATGMIPRSMEHRAQIMEVYLQSRLASLDCLDTDQVSVCKTYQDMLGEIAKPVSEGLPMQEPAHPETLAPPTNLAPVAKTIAHEPATAELDPVCLTPGVRLAHEPLTIQRLTEQFEAARGCNEPLHRSPAKQPYGVDIAGACERSIKIAQANGEMDDKTADARRSRVKTFCLLAGVQTVTEVEQFHFRVFEERVENLRNNFLKRKDDALLTWMDLEAEALELEDEQLGRAPSTYNSYLEQFGAVLKHARFNEGSAVDRDLDPSLLRRQEKVRARSKRNAFQPDEINALFQHPVWQGCRSDARRHEHGNQVIKDGLFFVPLIVAYSGGRMEEIAGLTVNAIVEVDGQYGLDIRTHEERRIKNAHSERLIPIHEHLLELGLLDYRGRMMAKGERLLFPELRPTSVKKKFMSALRYNWRKIREGQLGGNPKGLDGHSLRHSFNQALKTRPEVLKDVRLDLLGHAGADLNEEVYGDVNGMPFDLKRAAIDLLPRVF